MMYFKRHLPDIEQWSQSSGSNVIPRRARPGLWARLGTEGPASGRKFPPREPCQQDSRHNQREDLQAYLAHKSPPPLGPYCKPMPRDLGGS